MRKMVVILSKPYKCLVSRQMVQGVRYWRKWDGMDIAYIPPIELISCIVVQKRHYGRFFAN